MSVYLPNIPAANDIISVSQGQLQTNFQQIDNGVSNGIANDHISLTNATAADRGHHANIRFVQQGADPATAVDQIGLYAKDVGGTPRLFIREESNGTIYQLNANNPSLGTTGYTWLPGGLLLQWGNQSATGANPVTFPVAFTTTYQVVGITNANDRAFAVTNITATNFTFSVDNPIAAVTIRWMAIGLA